MVSRIKVAAVAALCLFAGSMAQAEGAYRYSGISIGASAIDVDDTDFDESDIGFKWFGGVMVNQNFGFELSYIYGGTINSSSSILRSVESNAFTIEALGQFPVGGKFSLFARAGIAFYDAYDWLMGSLVDRSLAQAAFAGLPALLAIVLLLRLSPSLDALALGEEVAESLGHDLRSVRLQVICLSAFGVGACVAICGAIGFIGLVAPIFARRLTGGHPGRAILPAALIGAEPDLVYWFTFLCSAFMYSKPFSSPISCTMVASIV